MKIVKALARKGLEALGLQVFRAGSAYAQDGLVTGHSDRFRSTPAFREAYDRGLAAAAGVDPQFEWRVHVALWAAKEGLKAAGDFVECGVNAGFMSSSIMHSLRWNEVNRRFFLVDTWDGPPMSQYNTREVGRGRRKAAEAARSVGAYVTDLERVRRNFAEWPNAIVVQGVVPDILRTIPAGPVAFLHLDMNCALPERAALEFFWHRMSPGAMVLLDDYAYHGYEEQAAAIDAFAAEAGADVLALPTGQGIIGR